MTKSGKQDFAQENREAGWAIVACHPLLSSLAARVGKPYPDPNFSPSGWAALTPYGRISTHPSRRAAPKEWAFVFAHLLLHMGFDHTNAETALVEKIDASSKSLAYQAAACVNVNRFLQSLSLGTPPEALPLLPVGDEKALSNLWQKAIPLEFQNFSVAGQAPDIVLIRPFKNQETYPSLLAKGLSSAVVKAVEVAGGARESLTSGSSFKSPWDLALSWFVSSYPLLGAIASSLKVVSSPDIVDKLQVDIAAVSVSMGEIYINSRMQYSSGEWKFILAHEMLHAALKHEERTLGRDPELWNIACDFVINSWLIEMGIGVMPEGLLYDAQFDKFSAEEVYDQITANARMYRKLAALAGKNKTEWVTSHLGPGSSSSYVDLDEFFRRSLQQGLEFHNFSKGTLPFGLVEEIRALDAPPLTWDIQLARWFDEFVPTFEPRRSYARPSRRQASTSIPRPGKVHPELLESSPTFGVVLDTSGSMSPYLLGLALGSIASFSQNKGVLAARVVYCDAIAYDAGYITPSEITSKVKVKGRGGTMLQPGINALEKATDFPSDGPILVITDGECEPLEIKRPHAFLLPANKSLPFRPKGPVFRLC